MKSPVKMTRLLFVLMALSINVPVLAQQSEETDKKSSPVDEVAIRQSRLAAKYEQLEMLMLKMAEYDADTNPGRSDLLKKALSQSKDRHTRLNMETLAKLINQQQYKRAIDNQGVVKADLQELLQLLLSENRQDRLRDQQNRVRNYIKELEQVIRKHKSVMGRTEGGEDAIRLSDAQGRVADQAKKLGDKIDENEGTSAGEEGSEGEDGSEGRPRR